MENYAISHSGFDIVKAEIIRQQLYNIAQEMGTVMIRTSGDPVISEAVDFSTFLADQDGAIISFSGYMTMHAGPARQAVKHILRVIPREDIRPGDAFICNDPHTTGACHPPDVGIIKPIFYKEDLIAWCWAEGHLLDVGGMSPGGFAPGAYDAYSEALRFPAIKIVSEGKLIDDVRRLIEANFRLPGRNLNDIRCFIAACNVAERRIVNLIDKYGLEEYRRYIELNNQLSEEAFRRRISLLPKKSYEGIDWIEHNGHVNELFPVRCRLTIEQESMTIDFTGTAPQTDGFVNLTEGSAIGCVITPIMLVLTPDIPFNEGIFRPINLVLPEGSVVNARMPAPTSSGHMEAGMRVTRILTNLLSRAMMESEDEWVQSHAMANFHDSWIAGTFAGPDSAGNPTVFLDMNGGGAGGGAQTVCDGLDAAATFTQLSNGLPDIEVNELSFPVLYLWRRLNVNSGGPGLHRGGQGIDFAWIPWGTSGGQEHVNSACWQVPPLGLMGGYPGGTSGFSVIKNSNVYTLMEQGYVPTVDKILGEREELPSKHMGFPINPGDVFMQFEGGGGGLGDPLNRDPDRVAKDFRDGYISEKMMQNAYGVVLASDGTVDLQKTIMTRQKIRELRLANSTPPAEVVPTAPSELSFLRRCGESLIIKIDNKNHHWFCCAECENVLSDGNEDWKKGAAVRECEIAEEFGRFDMYVKRRIEPPYIYLREYVCPGCGNMLTVEIAARHL